jgi:general stress protein YciG
MITHTIYHIPGVKVGCTRNFKVRMDFYRLRYGKDYISKVEILEELLGKTDQEVGDREWFWADSFGYRRGAHYSKSAWRHVSPEQQANGGYRRAEVLSSERLSEIGRKAAMSPTVERRSEIGRNAGLASSASRSVEQKSELGRMAGLAMAKRRSGSQYKLGQCPHCGTETTLAVLGRLHLDRCSKRKIGFVRGN